jgi:hypothetical protein
MYPYDDDQQWEYYHDSEDKYLEWLGRAVKDVNNWQQEVVFTVSNKIKVTFHRHNELIKADYQLL